MSSNKKKPVIVLKTKNVIILASCIIILCVLFLVLNIVLASPPKNVALQDDSESVSEIASAVPEEVPTISSPPIEESPIKEDIEPKVPEEDKNVGKENLPLETAKEEEQSIINKYDFPLAVNGAILAFIIDDAGENIANVERYATLPFPLTIAVLPRVSHSKECADVIRANGKEVILHQPMQAINLSVNPGPGAINGTMEEPEILQTVRENIDRIGPIKGMNNHEGSLITSDLLKISAVLKVCKEKNIYFIDSRTALPEDNKVRQAATEVNIKILERNAPFLDNAVTEEEMIKEIKKSVDVANKYGKAIIIGHVDKSVEILPALLADMYPELVQKGYRFLTPSQIY